MMNTVFGVMVSLIVMANAAIASHPLDPRPIPRQTEPSDESVKPVDYEEDTEE